MVTLFREKRVLVALLVVLLTSFLAGHLVCSYHLEVPEVFTAWQLIVGKLYIGSIIVLAVLVMGLTAYTLLLELSTRGRK